VRSVGEYRAVYGVRVGGTRLAAPVEREQCDSRIELGHRVHRPRPCCFTAVAQPAFHARGVVAKQAEVEQVVARVDEQAGILGTKIDGSLLVARRSRQRGGARQAERHVELRRTGGEFGLGAEGVRLGIIRPRIK